MELDDGGKEETVALSGAVDGDPTALQRQPAAAGAAAALQHLAMGAEFPADAYVYRLGLGLVAVHRRLELAAAAAGQGQQQPAAAAGGNDQAAVEYNHGAQQRRPYQGYWTDSERPPPFLKAQQGVGPEQSNGSDAVHPVSLDAAKRRTLPLWIRQGLEKMEEDKRKATERETARQARDQLLRSRREQEALAPADPLRPDKSKFDSSSEDSASDGERDAEEDGDQREQSPAAPEPPPDTGGAGRRARPEPEPESPAATLLLMTPEERQQVTVALVRRFLTELLLDVTGSEMRDLAEEVLQRQRDKAPQKRVQAVPTVSRPLGLGLAMYGSGSSDSESDSDSGDDSKRPRRADGSGDDSDSDAELEAAIRRRRQEFAVREREIMARLQTEQQEEEEQEQGRGGERSAVHEEPQRPKHPPPPPPPERPASPPATTAAGGGETRHPAPAARASPASRRSPSDSVGSASSAARSRTSGKKKKKKKDRERERRSRRSESSERLVAPLDSRSELGRLRSQVSQLQCSSHCGEPPYRAQTASPGRFASSKALD
ncbi:Arginine/serine-rich protein PNISR [Amphibalanus amphitrite]|uniref:Arginine/serine-rich protein PNISR n=1 Tax=Amphibalanus amphitrite TaxID=1232801 RepID=A0A6A4XB23_AMPAM|nr:Arginine/serine-rich protein PNISR [Amphibalanus amphitrite]KAF0312409.1 Arginine/serine-rich protein PNISR [Amphibalanus amphitrite]